jgi:hypothetical protein
VRTADGGWQLLGMDTGYYDTNPADQFNTFYAGPWLHDTEVTWLQHKLDTFEGVTVLLSHHQLYSANAKLNGSASPYRTLQYMNPYLYRAFRRYFDTDVAAWLWGHEHNFVLYRDGQFGLAKGRLVGCSAYEELVSSDPYAVRYPEVSYLDPTRYRLGAAGGYYNHGYAVLDLAGRTEPAGAVEITYYQYPSWGDTAPPRPAEEPIYAEKLTRPRGGRPHLPVDYGTSLYLFSRDGSYVGPFEKHYWYYPTGSWTAPVPLQITGGSGVVRHGDRVRIQTREPAAGSYDALTVGSTPALWYDTSGSSAQLWEVRKRDPSDPQVHYGDDVCFVSTSYPGQYLQPYWSTVWAGTYLTTRAGDPAYWTALQAVPR